MAKSNQSNLRYTGKLFAGEELASQKFKKDYCKAISVGAKKSVLDDGVKRRLDCSVDKTGRRSGDGDWEKIVGCNRHCGNASKLEMRWKR